MGDFSTTHLNLGSDRDNGRLIGQLRPSATSGCNTHRQPEEEKKHNGRLITSYRLPRLDEMVLLQPISTRSDGASKDEKTRVDKINERLDTYNRWLAFVPDSRPGRSVRTAAQEMQQSVHDLNEMIASMMIKVDQKIADLADRTEGFVAAVQDGGTWQTRGDLLGIRLPLEICNCPLTIFILLRANL